MIKSFKNFLLESVNKPKSVGKNIGGSFYVHKDYINQSKIPVDEYTHAQKRLQSVHRGYEHTIVKYTPKTKDFSFLHSPDFDTNHEPTVSSYVNVKPDSVSSIKPLNKIYHQKWSMVGSDYSGFDVEKNKQRTKEYTDVIQKLAKENNVPTREYSSRIQNRDFWDKHIMPHLDNS